MLALAGALVAVSVWFAWPTDGNPPGFFRDEASISASAHALSTTFRDERGGLLPLYFVSFEDYKSPIFVYVLAGVFRVTGPHADAARGLATASVLAAVLLLALLAYRRTSSQWVALAVFGLAATTPWLYELGRVAFEVTMLPLFLCVLLLVLDGASRRERWTIGRGVATGLSLAAIAYGYAAGRLLAPLVAAALVVFLTRGRWRFLAVAWGTFTVLLAPLVAYWFRHSGALTARYEATTFVGEGRSGLPVVWDGLRNYLTDIAPWRWLVDGDPKPYIHASDYPALPVAVVGLALAGAAIVLVRKRADRWWLYVLVLTLLAPVAAALTEDRMHQLRLALLPVLGLVLTTPAVDALLHPARHRLAATAVVGVLAVVTAVQVVHWQLRYRESGPGRTELFEVGVASLLDEAFATDEPVHVDLDDHQAQAHLLWGAAERGVSERVVVLTDGGVPPDGSLVFGRFQECDYTCVVHAREGDYWLARAAGT